MLIFKHPPRGRTMDKRLEDGINSLCLNDEWVDNIPIYHPSDGEKNFVKITARTGI